MAIFLNMPHCPHNPRPAQPPRQHLLLPKEDRRLAVHCHGKSQVPLQARMAFSAGRAPHPVTPSRTTPVRYAATGRPGAPSTAPASPAASPASRPARVPAPAWAGRLVRAGFLSKRFRKNTAAAALVDGKHAKRFHPFLVRHQRRHR